MIIIVSGDQITMDSAWILKAYYPKEVGHRINSFLINSKDEINLETDNSLPERLTFVGHTSWTKFGGFTPTHLAEHIIAQIHSAVKINHEIRKSIKTIDLVSCHTGFVDEKGDSFASAFAKKIALEGFADIKVKSFTNKSLEQPQPFYRLGVTPHIEDNSFYVSGFRTQEDFKKYEFVKDQFIKLEKKESELNYTLLGIRSELSSIKKTGREVEEKIKKIYDEIEKLKNNAENITKISNKFQLDFSITPEDKNSHIKYKINEIDIIKNEMQQDFIIKKTTLKDLYKRKDQLIKMMSDLQEKKITIYAEVNEIIKKIEILTTREKELQVIVCTTTDVRISLDTDPHCDFTASSIEISNEKTVYKL